MPLVTQGYGSSPSTNNPNGLRVGGTSASIQTIQQAQGVDQVYEIDVYDSTGITPVAAGVYTGQEPLTARLWAGDGQVAQTLSGVAWQTVAPVPPNPVSLTLTVRATDTAALTIGTYRVQITTVTQNSLTQLLWDGALKLTASPGSAIALPVYCQYSDMLAICPWIDTISDARRSQTDFAEVRAAARQYLDQLLIKNYRNLNAFPFQLGSGGAINVYIGPRQPIYYNQWVTQQLAANALMLSPEVVRGQAYYSLYLALSTVPSRNGTSDYGRFADFFFHQSRNLMFASTFQLDTNNDGFPENAIIIGTPADYHM